MHVILFNRISSSSVAFGIYEQCETREEAIDIMREAYATYTLDKGFDPQFSNLDEEHGYAFISTYNMDDYIIMFDDDTDNPAGLDCNPYMEFARFMDRLNESNM